MPRSTSGGAAAQDNESAGSPPSPRDLAGAASIAGAIFGALVGADPFDIHNRARSVQYLDYVAIALWAAALLLFLFAIAPLQRRVSSAWRLKSALVVAAGAGALTVVALAVVPFGFSEDKDSVALKLAPNTRQRVDELCGTTGAPLRGKIPTTSLADEFVIFAFQKETRLGCDTIRIPRAGILVLEEHPEH